MTVGPEKLQCQIINFFPVTVRNILSYGLEKSVLTIYFHFYSPNIMLWKDKFSQQHFVKTSWTLLCTFSESVFNTLYIETKHKFPSGKINSTKNALFFLLQARTYHSFTFNLWFLYELKHKIHLSETVHGIFYFLFLLNKMHGLFNFKISSFLSNLKY